MNCIIYTRVSTEEQVNNYSLLNQEKTCREYCEKQGWNVIKVFKEEGESAKTANRTKLIELLHFCVKNKKAVDVVLVYKFDRLARNVNDHTGIKAQLIAQDIILRSATEAVDNSPGGTFMENIMAAVAQFDNEVRGQRAKAGMIERVRQGYWAWPAPFGYRTQDGLIIPIPETAKLINECFSYYVETPMTVRQITDTLNAKGLRGRKGRKMLPQDISKILRNKVYMGVIDANKSWGFEVEGIHPPIVSKELFLRAELKMNGLSKTDDRRLRQNPKFPLKNITRCPKCRRTFTGSSPRGRSKSYPYYHCTSCRSPSVKKEVIEQAFTERLKRIQMSKNMNKLFIAVLKDCWKEKHKTANLHARQLSKELEALEERKDALIDKLTDGTVSSADYSRRAKKLDIEILAKRTEISDNRGVEVDMDYYINLAETLINNVATLYQEIPFEYQVKFQEMIFPSGVIYENKNSFGTAEIGLPFKEIPTSTTTKELLVTRMPFCSNTCWSGWKGLGEVWKNRKCLARLSLETSLILELLRSDPHPAPYRVCI